jgi:thiol-disulfide isomerase/thioredoxin
LARRKSHLHKADPKIGEAAYFGGYLASLSQEIADEDLLAQLQRGNYNTQQEYNDFIDSFTDKTIAQAKEILQKKHDDKSAAIDATTYSAACKELLHIANDLTFFSGLSNTKTYMVYAYSIQHKIGNDQAALNKYAATITYPTDFYAPIKQLKYVNAPERCYSLLGISYPIGKAEIASCLGTDKGFLFDDMNASEAYRQLVDYQLLNNARLATVPESYLAYMQKKNDELAKKIEASKNKGGYEVKEISPDVAGKDILPQIIAQYKGKPIMIDIWGTWCNPCKIANKALAPVKEELKDKDIVYVFIAGENSPKDTWNIMITDLHGVHYRLTDKQWSDILSANESAGVPAYFYIDKTGKIVDKQIGFGGVEPMKKQLLEISK